eukprot:scaffold674428_cov73-Prasinocladus_malaysianus.AAC.1
MRLALVICFTLAFSIAVTPLAKQSKKQQTKKQSVDPYGPVWYRASGPPPGGWPLPATPGQPPPGDPSYLTERCSQQLDPSLPRYKGIAGQKSSPKVWTGCLALYFNNPVFNYSAVKS